MFFLEDQKYKDKKVKDNPQPPENIKPGKGSSQDNPQPPENIKPGKGSSQKIISAVSTESK